MSLLDTIKKIVSTIVTGGNNSNSGSGSPSKTPSTPSPPPSITGIDPSQITKGTVQIITADGKVHERKDMPLYNGAFYDPSTGKILSDVHGPDGIFENSEWDTSWRRNDDGTVTGIFTERPPSTSHSNGGGGGSEPPSPPPKPAKLDFSDPFPSFTSNIKEVSKYFYYFGIDEAIFSSVTYEKNSVFVSPIIDLGVLYDTDYLMLESTYTLGFNSSIEFYILDGTDQVPILPYDEEYVTNEQHFKNLPLRFQRNTTKSYTIKQDNHVIEMKLEDLLANVSGLTYVNKYSYINAYSPYTISYTPKDCWTYKPKSNQIQLKIVLRNYDSTGEMPSFKYVLIRKYSEEAPWTQKE